MAVDSAGRGDVLERAVTSIAEEVLPAAVLGVLEALGHHLGGLQVPEVELFGPVAGDEEVEAAVAVEVEPGGAARVDQGGKPAFSVTRVKPLPASLWKSSGRPHL